VIDPNAAKQALIEAQASITKAADRLGVKRNDLRRFVAKSPELVAVMLETTERNLDKAEQIILDGLDSRDKIKRLEAAGRILKGRFRAQR
jgi:hypothetical protein